MAQNQPPTTPSPRFTQELEFVLALANPVFLQHLAVTLPHIFNPSKPSTTLASSDNSDSAKFTRYLSYLQSYWSTPAYSQYLTHPAAVLRHLELLQNEQFRRDLTKPDLLPRLVEGYKGAAVYQPPNTASAEESAAITGAEGNTEVPQNEAAAQ